MIYIHLPNFVRKTSGASVSFHSWQANFRGSYVHVRAWYSTFRADMFIWNGDYVFSVVICNLNKFHSWRSHSQGCQGDKPFSVDIPLSRLIWYAPRFLGLLRLPPLQVRYFTRPTQWLRPGHKCEADHLRAKRRWETWPPVKINMEHTNHKFRKENDLPNLYDYVPC